MRIPPKLLDKQYIKRLGKSVFMWEITNGYLVGFELSLAEVLARVNGENTSRFQINYTNKTVFKCENRMIFSELCGARKYITRYTEMNTI